MTRWKTAAHLQAIGIPDNDLTELPDSGKRFPDGAHYRIEIPSTEGTACLRAVIEAAASFDIVIHRVSQGSGVALLTDQELGEIVDLGAHHRIEVSLFARANAGWDSSVMARTSAGSVLAAASRGQGQLRQALEEVERAAASGIRSVLIADLGVLSAFGSMRRSGYLPPDMQAKVSVMLPAANAAAARVLVDLGADTLNLPTDLTLAHIAAIRRVVDVPLDIYVESPDSIGGLVRIGEVVDIVRVAAPVNLKFGLRNAPDLYPYGEHLAGTAVAQARERVRRARIGVEALRRSDFDYRQSAPGAAGVALPQPRSRD